MVQFSRTVPRSSSGRSSHSGVRGTIPGSEGFAVHPGGQTNALCYAWASRQGTVGDSGFQIDDLNSTVTRVYMTTSADANQGPTKRSRSCHLKQASCPETPSTHNLLLS